MDEVSGNNITRCFIIAALIIIIYYFYFAQRNVTNANNTATVGESFVSSAWEDNEGLYRARARAYQWCPPEDCANRKIEAKDLVSFNPFRWPNSGGYYYNSLSKITPDGELFPAAQNSAASAAHATANTKNDASMDMKDGQQQDHVTMST